MLRTKKKQLNLKPNRVLDKRSSRGMLYENEELRLRTIHINDEVDRSHNDVKKLRKENEYLKREIWSLRDECEKLEEVIKKVYNGEAPPPDELPKYQPRLRKQSTISSKWDPARRGSGLSFSQYSFYDEDEDQQKQNDDEDDTQSTLDDRGQLTRQNSILQDTYYQDSQEVQETQEEPSTPVIVVHNDDDFNGEVCSSSSDNPPKINFYPHYPHWQMHAPELEAVTEESENSTSPNVSMDNQFKSDTHLNDPGPEIRYIDSRDTSVNSDRLPEGQKEVTTGSFYNPIIEITPASSSPTPSSSMPKTPTPEIPASSTAAVDLGCVTLIPKKYEAISELKIASTSEVMTIPGDDEKEFDRGRKISQESGTTVQDDKHSSFSLNSSDIEGLRVSTEPPYKSLPASRKNLTSNFPTPSIHTSATAAVSAAKSLFHSNTLLSHSELLSKKILPFFQSEPSLNSLPFESPPPPPASTSAGGSSNRAEGIGSMHLWSGFNGFDQSVEMCGVSSDLNCQFLHSVHGWNSVDKNLVVGYLEEFRKSDEPFWSELSAQEVIDELEAQFDPTLERIAGVRMLTLPGFHTPQRVFISLRTAAGVKLLIEKGFSVRGERVRLVDASQQAACSLVILSGLPASFPDSTVISMLNQFGQVVAPLERRVYKGVDISERLARMHLVRSIPTTGLTIGGYQVIGKVVEGAAELLPEKHRPSSSPGRTHPAMMSIPKHKPVARAVTLDSASPPKPATLSPTNASSFSKRKMSVCSAMFESGAGSSAGNSPKQGQQVKKPVQRPARSSPGSLIQGTEQFVSVESSCVGGGGKVLTRSMSFEPRRISNISKAPTEGSQLSLVDSQMMGHSPVTRQQSKYFPGQQRLMSGSNSSGHYLEKKEPLPWCGCWGNGCI